MIIVCSGASARAIRRQHCPGRNNLPTEGARILSWLDLFPEAPGLCVDGKPLEKIPISAHPRTLRSRLMRWLVLIVCLIAPCWAEQSHHHELTDQEIGAVHFVT